MAPVPVLLLYVLAPAPYDIIMHDSMMDVEEAFPLTRQETAVPMEQI
jgi:hypothetical protein